MELTIIISYYKAIDNLKIILKALNNQSNNKFEVILSEDDFNQATINFISENKHIYNFRISHLYQKEDNGFRKNKMLNKSILHSQSQKIVFIDGDCIPHKHFAKQYINHLKDGCFFSGRSVLLNSEISKNVLENQSLKQLNLLKLLFSSSKRIKAGIYSPFFSLSAKKRGLVGRNWGASKKDLLEINGFDEDYILAGVGEDSDIEWRLLENGIQMKSIKNKAIIYHLYHIKSYSQQGVRSNFKLMKKKQNKKNIICLNGIKKKKHKKK